MKFSLQTGLRPVATSLALAALLVSASALPLAPQSIAAEYKVAVKVKPSGLRSVRLYGSSPWVCTPSGFGQKARCYLRKAA